MKLNGTKATVVFTILSALAAGAAGVAGGISWAQKQIDRELEPLCDRVEDVEGEADGNDGRLDELEEWRAGVDVKIISIDKNVDWLVRNRGGKPN